MQQPFVGNIENLTIDNDDFRRVIYTPKSKNQQLVLMSIAVGEDIGMEVHKNVDQFIRIESGRADAILNGIRYPLKDGSAVVVPAGTQHNIINTHKTKALKLYTIYSPAQHPEGQIEVEKPKQIKEEITPTPK